MRDFYELNTVTLNEESGVISLGASGGGVSPRLSLRREGGYVSISISYGPLEMALRPRYPELTRVLGRLRPISGLQTTRQVGTGQAYLALGLREDNMLVVRPTIVADATGHLTYNLLLTDSVRQALYTWLQVEIETQDV